MNRRQLLAGIGALAASMALDPERMLWVPGRRTYFDLGAARHEEDFILGIVRSGVSTYRLDFGIGSSAVEFEGLSRRAGPREVTVHPVGPMRWTSVDGRETPAPPPMTVVTVERPDGQFELAELQRQLGPEDEWSMAGLRRMPDVTFDVVWKPGEK